MLTSSEELFAVLAVATFAMCCFVGAIGNYFEDRRPRAPIAVATIAEALPVAVAVEGVPAGLPMPEVALYSGCVPSPAALPRP